MEGVIRKIESIFTDDKTSPGIKMSSIHKSKGLEADNVFLLQPKGASIIWAKKGTKDWELEQMRNLAYVAITRARHTLTHVT